MRLLLDSQVVYLWMTGGTLPRVAQQAIGDERNHLAVSAATFWELGIKRARGKLPLTEEHLAALLDTDLEPLAISPAHALAAAALPPLHADPFDRMLVAQAQVEGMTLVGGDAVFAAYGAEVLWD